MNKFWSIYPDLQSDLNQVTHIIEETVRDSHKFIAEAVTETIHSGGKMIRPAFVILGSKFGEEKKDNILRLAAIVEMLHVATLIHDDIIDEAKLRRGVESVQSKYGKDTAVFIGDYLFAKIFTLINEDFNKETMQDLSKVIMKICQGELIQFSLRYKYNSGIIDYFRIITGKTASLIATSFLVGAHETNAKNHIKKTLTKMGYRIGMAFQIIDDCLDFSNNKTIKKSAMNDLKQGYFTLPVILALQNDKNNHLNNILKSTNFNDSDKERIYSLIIENQGLKKSRELAKKYTEKAFSSLNKLPECESKYRIEYITNQLLNRVY